MSSPNRDIVCPHCGAENRRSLIVTTCAKCGGPLAEGPATPPPPQPTPPSAAIARGVDARQDDAIGWRADDEVGVAEDDYDDGMTASLPLVPPPRPVPRLVRLHCLFGGVLAQVGWFFLGFGMVFVWVFGAAADPTPIYFALWGSETVGTVIASTERTSWEVNDRRVFAHHYRYTTRDGVERSGTAYAPGRRLDAGTHVTVEYVPSRPGISRIEGMGGGMIPLWAGAAILIFPLVGLGFVLGGVRRG